MLFTSQFLSQLQQQQQQVVSAYEAFFYSFPLQEEKASQSDVLTQVVVKNRNSKINIWNSFKEEHARLRLVATVQIFSEEYVNYLVALSLQLAPFLLQRIFGKI